MTDVHRVGDVTAPPRQTGLPNGWPGRSGKYQSNTQTTCRKQAGAGNLDDSYGKVDLHIDESQIEEPLNLQGRVTDRIAGEWLYYILT